MLARKGDASALDAISQALAASAPDHGDQLADLQALGIDHVISVLPRLRVRPPFWSTDGRRSLRCSSTPRLRDRSPHPALSPHKAACWSKDGRYTQRT